MRALHQAEKDEDQEHEAPGGIKAISRTRELDSILRRLWIGRRGREPVARGRGQQEGQLRLRLMSSCVYVV